jgi:hypothetical protein
MLRVGQHVRVSGFPNLRMEVTKIVEAAGRGDSDAHISTIEIAFRYIDPFARLLDLKLPSSLIIKTHDGRLFARLRPEEVSSIRRGLEFGDFDDFEDIVDRIYHSG